jgi:hypothetical protein
MIYTQVGEKKGVHMSAATLGANEKEPLPASGSIQFYATERRLRRISAWLVLYLLLQAGLGLAWDRRWHDTIGRDQFWIPPHIMLYTGVGCAGLIALFVVLVDSLRYYQRKPGVDDDSTVSVLRIFHAPLGFILLGFGTLTDLIAAPLDNYWHELYGIDVTLWSPFHIMGTLGGVMAGIGIIYAFASEAAIERQSGRPSHLILGLNSLELGTIILLSAITNLTIPALTAFAAFTIGPVQFLAYPLPLTLAGGFALIAAAQLTRKPGTATLMSLILWLHASLTQAFVPWALRFMAATLGLTFRYGGSAEPNFNAALALMPLVYFLSALLVDGFAYWQFRQPKTRLEGLRNSWLLGALITLPMIVLPPCIVLVVQSIPALPPLSPDTNVLEPLWFAMLPTLPLAVALGGFAASCGEMFGDIWHWNMR